MLHFKDLVAAVAAQPTAVSSTLVLVRGVHEALASIKSKADVQRLAVDLENNIVHLAGALSYGTPLQHAGQVTPSGVDPPVMRVIEQMPEIPAIFNDRLADGEFVPIEAHRSVLAEIERLRASVAALQAYPIDNGAPKVSEQANGPIDDPSAAGQSQSSGLDGSGSDTSPSSASGALHQGQPANVTGSQGAASQLQPGPAVPAVTLATTEAKPPESSAAQPATPAGT